MRKTTINVSEGMDKEVGELLKLTDHDSFIRVVEAAVYNYLRMVKSSGTYWPTYPLDKVYVEADDKDDEAATIRVRQDVEGGPFYYRLRKAKDTAELLTRPFYVEVKNDDLVYPRAVFDFEEVKPPPESDYWKIFKMFHSIEEWKPAYFQRGGLVATPQLGLI